LIEQKMDVRLIAKWQGHSDARLILSGMGPSSTRTMKKRRWRRSRRRWRQPNNPRLYRSALTTPRPVELTSNAKLMTMKSRKCKLSRKQPARRATIIEDLDAPPSQASVSR
jgi:hypothetical protein